MINEKEAIDKVDDYLITYIGNLVSSGTPFFNKKEKMWVVPIVKVSNEKNVLSEIKLSESGEIVYAPTREKLIELTKNSKKEFVEKAMKKIIKKDKILLNRLARY